MSIHTEGLVCMRDADGTAIVNLAQKHKHHSPTGFEWGYAGSGPAELALNVLAEFLPVARGEPAAMVRDGSTVSDEAWRLHQRFKHDFIEDMPREGGTIPAQTIIDWLESRVGGSK